MTRQEILDLASKVEKRLSASEPLNDPLTHRINTDAADKLYAIVLEVVRDLYAAAKRQTFVP